MLIKVTFSIFLAEARNSLWTKIPACSPLPLWRRLLRPMRTSPRDCKRVEASKEIFRLLAGWLSGLGYQGILSSEASSRG